jgi:hypothetical protein
MVRAISERSQISDFWQCIICQIRRLVGTFSGRIVNLHRRRLQALQRL